jgi:predicted RNA binding protein YcfA (HicA-like mRNA interferase family)
VGKLAGFRYRDIVKRLKELGLQFDCQARGSHEIWFNPVTRRYATITDISSELFGIAGMLKLNVSRYKWKR